MSHYFERSPESASKPRVVLLRLTEREVELVADRGVFSAGGIDRGTQVLLETVPSPEAGATVLDLGCGYGPIAIALALRTPSAAVWAVDVNARACELAARNAAAAGAVNVAVTEPGGVPPDLRFGAIYSNPPVRIGKTPLHELLEHWLARLAPGGHAYLVVQRHLGSDSLARWLGDGGWLVRRLGSRAGYRVLDVSTGRF